MLLSTIKTARLLGWTSLAVGGAELLATRWLQDELGVRDQQGLIRAFGIREIANGVAILQQRGLDNMLLGTIWARVAGDAIDLAALGAAAERSRNPEGLKRITSLVLGVTAVDLIVALSAQLTHHRGRAISHRARLRVRRTDARPRPDDSAVLVTTEPETHGTQG